MIWSPYVHCWRSCNRAGPPVLPGTKSFIHSRSRSDYSSNSNYSRAFSVYSRYWLGYSWSSSDYSRAVSVHSTKPIGLLTIDVRLLTTSCSENRVWRLFYNFLMPSLCGIKRMIITLNLISHIKLCALLLWVSNAVNTQEYEEMSWLYMSIVSIEHCCRPAVSGRSIVGPRLKRSLVGITGHHFTISEINGGK